MQEGRGGGGRGFSPSASGAGVSGDWRRRPQNRSGADPINTFLARTWDRELPSGARTGVGRRGALPLRGREKGGEGRHRIPVPTPGASITRKVSQHRPMGPEAQDLLHRQVDHGVVAPLRLHLPWGTPAALSSGAGRRRRLRGSGGGGGCAAPPGRRRRGRLRVAGLVAAAAADGPPGGAAQRVSQAAPSPPGRHRGRRTGEGRGPGALPARPPERGLGSEEAAAAPSQGQLGARRGGRAREEAEVTPGGPG